MIKLRRWIGPLLMLALMGAAFIPWNEVPSRNDRLKAMSGVKFVAADLPDAASNQRVRTVEPELAHIAPWISSVGASVAAFDLRGQGLAGDGCLTDPRDNQVRVFAIPHSLGRPFPTFTLNPDGLLYNNTMAPMGCVPTDINQDGRQDVIVYYWGRSPVIFYNHARPGQTPSRSMFTAAELVSPMQVWNTTALNVADLDGDGLPDIMVGNYFPDGARVLDPAATQDARMQMQHSMGNADNGGTNHLYLSTRTKTPGGPVSFVDQSVRIPPRSARSWTLAFGAQDLTGNGLPDIYVANDFGPDQLLINHSTVGNVDFQAVVGARDLTTAKSKTLGRDSFKGMGVVYSYQPESTMPRIFVSNITSEWALEESNLAFYPDGPGAELLNGKLPYTEEAARRGIAHSGWAWDIKAIDPTNSGQDDLVQAVGFIAGTRNMWPRLQETAMQNDQLLSHPGAWLSLGPNDGLSGDEPNRLWAPTKDGQFVDIGAAAGFQPGQISRGIAVTDVNNDGLDDFLVARQWGRSHVYLNHSTSENNWTTLRVVRPAAFGSTPLTGAKVTIHSGQYSKTAQLYPANGHSGVSGANLHFALPGYTSGTAITADVAWRDANGLHHRSYPVTTGLHELRIQP